jgi:hypothetical protein
LLVAVSCYRNHDLALSNATPENSQETARLLCAGAVGFLIAAKATHERHLHQPGEPEHWPAISVNLCFALELSLKAFIALHGGNRSTLKKIGHNLASGLTAACEAGYSPKHPSVPELIAILSPLHVSHNMRYLENKSASLPDTRNMISIVNCHVREVGRQIVTQTSNLSA